MSNTDDTPNPTRPMPETSDGPADPSIFRLHNRQHLQKAEFLNRLVESASRTGNEPIDLKIRELDIALPYASGYRGWLEEKLEPILGQGTAIGYKPDEDGLWDVRLTGHAAAMYLTETRAWNAAEASHKRLVRAVRVNEPKPAPGR